MREQATVVLVHGAWHGAWCWEPLVRELETLGIPCVTIDLPSCAADPARRGGLLEDARAVEALIERTPGPLVVVGHSYGGMVVSEAATSERVARLVYLCAFMPEAGRSLVSHFDGPPPPYAVFRDDGTIGVQHAHETFYLDCDAETVRWAVPKLVPHDARGPTTPTTRAAWASRPATYVVCSEDRAIPPALQERFATQAARVHRVATSHSPMLSRPAELARLLAGELEA